MTDESVAAVRPEVAAVLAEHWTLTLHAESRTWKCACGALVADIGELVDSDARSRRHRLHVAAAIAASGGTQPEAEAAPSAAALSDAAEQGSRWVVDHLQSHLTDGLFHESCAFCLYRRSHGGTGVRWLDTRSPVQASRVAPDTAKVLAEALWSIRRDLPALFVCDVTNFNPEPIAALLAAVLADQPTNTEGVSR